MANTKPRGSIQRTGDGPRGVAEIAAQYFTLNDWESGWGDPRQRVQNRAHAFLLTRHPELTGPLLEMLKAPSRGIRVVAALHPLLKGHAEIVPVLKDVMKSPLPRDEELLYSGWTSLWTRAALRLLDADGELRSWVEPKARERSDLLVLAKLKSEALVAIARRATDKREAYLALASLGPSASVPAELLRKLAKGIFGRFSSLSDGREQAPFWALAPLAVGGVPRALPELLHRLPETAAVVRLLGAAIAPDLAAMLEGPLVEGAFVAHRLLREMGEAAPAREVFVERTRVELPPLLRRLDPSDSLPAALLTYVVEERIDSVGDVLADRLATRATREELAALRGLDHPRFEEVALAAGKNGWPEELMHVGTKEAWKLFNKKADDTLKAQRRVAFPESTIKDVENAAAAGYPADAFRRAAELGPKAVLAAAHSLTHSLTRTSEIALEARAALRELAHNDEFSAVLEELTWHDHAPLALAAREAINDIDDARDPTDGVSISLADIVEVPIAVGRYPALDELDEAELLPREILHMGLSMFAAEYAIAAEFAHRAAERPIEGQIFGFTDREGDYPWRWEGRLCGDLVLDRMRGEDRLSRYASEEAARKAYEERVAEMRGDPNCAPAWCDYAPLPIRLRTLDSKLRDQRETALARLEADATPPKLPAGAKLILAGKPKYYSKQELQKHIESHGFSVTTKVKEATHALVMTKPGKKLEAILEAELPIVLEIQVRDLAEAAAPELLTDDSPAIDNVEALLLSDDDANVKLGLDLLGAGSLPSALLPVLLALSLFCPDNGLRRAAKKVLLAKAPDPISKRFENDRRNYASMSKVEKLHKLIKELEGLDIAGAELAPHLVRFAAREGSKQDLENVLSAALAFEPSGESLFPLIPHDTYNAISLVLTSVTGAVPGGLSHMTKLEDLHCYQCRFAEGAFTTPALERFHMVGGTLHDAAALAGLTTLTGIDINVVLPTMDLSPLAALSGVTDLQLCLRDSDRRRFEHYREPGDVPKKAKWLDLAPLSQLTGLEVVKLNGLVRDLTPLASLPKLRELDIQNTPLEDLTPLHAIASLRKLTLGPRLTESHGDELRRALPKLTIA